MNKNKLTVSHFCKNIDSDTGSDQCLYDIDENSANIQHCIFEKEFNELITPSIHSKIISNNEDEREMQILNSEASQDDQKWEFIRQQQDAQFSPFTGDEDGLEEPPKTVSTLSRQFDSVAPTKAQE